MEIEVASEKLNNETAQLHSQAETPQMAPGSQRKSIQEDVLIYIVMWLKNGQRENIAFNTEKAGEELNLYREMLNGESALQSECHTKGTGVWSECKGSSVTVPS